MRFCRKPNAADAAFLVANLMRAIAEGQPASTSVRRVARRYPQTGRVVGISADTAESAHGLTNPKRGAY